jgi:uroporphyrinogen decarboxylase
MHEGQDLSGVKTTGKLLETLAGTRFPTPPVWLMRQAGRYLPEYRAIRATTRSFLEFCYTPDKAIEVTLQPIRRFELDAAIIFSDILVVPDALGQKVWFEEGEGPKLEALTDPSQFGKLSRARLPDHLAPVYQAIRQTRAALPKDTALLGFAGAPFTLACYMIEGSGSRDFAKVKTWAYSHPESFGLLIDLLVEAVVDHLDHQVTAGADAVQLFDSWAGILPEEQLFRWSLEPMVRIANELRERHPKIPVIAFPRAVGPAMLMYRRPETFSVLSIDTGIGAHWAARELQPHICLQGNLDPMMLVAGGAALEREAGRILDKLGHGPFVFNLGHGVVPQTPPDNVARLVEIVRNWKPSGS